MKVVFLGGPQARALCEVYRQVFGSAADAVWVDRSRQLGPAQQALLAAADKVVIQTRDEAPTAELDGLDAKAEILLIPEIGLDFLWPFGGQTHVNNTATRELPDGPFPVEFGDAWLNRRLEAGYPPESIEADYLKLDVARVVDLDAYQTLALDRQAEIDKLCGVDFTSRLEAGFRQAPLFSNPLSPGVDLMRDLANLMLARLGSRVSLTRDWPVPQGTTDLPVHPSVAAHFGLRWTEGRLYRAPAGGRIDFTEYVRRYLAYAEGPELETGLALTAQGHGRDGLQRLKVAVARPAGQRSASAQRVLDAAAQADPRLIESAAALRLGRPGENVAPELAHAASLFAAAKYAETETAALAFLRDSPDSLDALLLLSLVRDKRGDVAGRADALAAAVNLRPNNPALQSRLTSALVAKGDLEGAIVSSEKEVALLPRSPQARASLAHLLERAGHKARARAELAEALAIIADGPEYGEVRGALNQRRVVAEEPG